MVSVCVVTYNHARYIRDCVMSVIAQAEDVSLEILIGDDQSTDETGSIVAELAAEYPALIRYFRHPERIGGTENYLFLIERATGDYVAHLDGDDSWLPGKLRQQVRLLEQHPDCPAVYTNALAVDNQGRTIGMFNNPQPERFDINELLRRGNFLNHSSLLYRGHLRRLLLDIAPPFLDYRIHLTLVRQGAVAYLNEVLVSYRVASSSSIIVNANEHVRQLYWEALLDVPKTQVDDAALAGSMAEFMRSVVFRSIRLRSWSLVREWWPRVLAGAPEGGAMMAIRTAAAVLRTSLRFVVDRGCGYVSGNGTKILYRR
jgi:glycosyltransferase involved in cell wall biosynthesis